MPVFKKKRIEIVDARQFTGGVQNGTDLVFWVNSNDGSAEWHDVNQDYPELVVLRQVNKYLWDHVYAGDWIVRNQNGSFSAKRPQDFEAEYVLA